MNKWLWVGIGAVALIWYINTQKNNQSAGIASSISYDPSQVNQGVEQ